MRTKLHTAKREHEVVYQDLCRLMNKHADKLTSLELLAVAANMLGKLLAMQDQRTVSPAMALEVLSTNIEYGNKQVVDQLSQSKGSA